MENQPTNEPTLSLMNGGVEITVRHLDGTEETVKVRRLPLRLLPTYGTSQGDEYKLCEMYTEKDAAWLDTVDPDDQVKIVLLGDELNTSFFAEWAERRLKQDKRIKELTPTAASRMSAAPSSTATSTNPAT